MFVARIESPQCLSNRFGQSATTIPPIDGMGSATTCQENHEPDRSDDDSALPEDRTDSEVTYIGVAHSGPTQARRIHGKISRKSVKRIWYSAERLVLPKGFGVLKRITKHWFYA
jgi:hypothetical protein